MEYTISLKNYGKYLLTRPQAGELREEAQQAINDYDTIIIDFDGIPAIGPSFADEFFGKLVALLGQKEFLARFKFKGLSDLNRNVLRIAIINRSEPIKN